MMYFTFRIKGRTRDHGLVTISVDFKHLQSWAPHNIAANVTARAAATLSCYLDQLALVEPETSIQTLADRQRRLPFGGVAWCELQGAIDRLSLEDRR